MCSLESHFSTDVMRRPIILAVLFIVTIGQAMSHTSASDDKQLMRKIDAADRRSSCRLTERKILEGDTDRGMEVANYHCGESLEKIVVLFGLSKKDLIFRYVLTDGNVARLEVSERKYRSTADAGPDFKNPLPPTIIGVFYFAGARLISSRTSTGNLVITEQNKPDKTAAFLRMVEAAQAALRSTQPHPEFDAVSLLTAIFG